MSSKVRSFKRAADKHAKADSINITLQTLINSQGAFRSLALQPLPGKVAFGLSKTAKAIQNEIDAYEIARTTMCERYANKDENGKAIVIPATDQDKEHYDLPTEQLEAFNKELSELVQTEVSLAANQIKIETLNGINIPAAHLILLDWLVVE